MFKTYQNILLFLSYGKVKIGERTILDPLQAAATAISSVLENKEAGEQNIDLAALKAGVMAAEENAKKTKRKKYPDPGAHAIAIIFRAILEAIKMKFSFEATKVQVHVQF